MKNTIHINQSAILWHRYNIKGTTLDTWALFDVIGNGSLKSKEIKEEWNGWIWVNPYYIKEMLPLCRFNKQKIKKHLNLLQKAGLIELEISADDDLFCRAIKPIEL